MKIAVISDIHANLIALKEVLKDIDSEVCDRIVCLGDIVLAGPQPKETIDFVRKQDWTIIQGNTDKMIADYDDNIAKMLRDNFPIMANAVIEDMKLLSEDDFDYLRELPETLSLEFEGVKTLLVHGSPRRNNEDILPNLPLEQIEEIVKGVKEELVLCGHTHVPCGYQTESEKTVVNVGSVGRPMTQNPDPCYAIIEFDDGKFSVKHKFVDYDRELAANLICKRNFEGKEKLAALLFNTDSRHV